MIMDLMVRVCSVKTMTGTLSKPSSNKKVKVFTGTPTVVNEVFEAMADRWSKSLGEEFEGNTTKASKLHTNQMQANTFRMRAQPLDIMLLLHGTGVSLPEFKATPGEVMDVFSAFRDYSVGMENDELAHDVSTDIENNVETANQESSGRTFC